MAVDRHDAVRHSGAADCTGPLIDFANDVGGFDVIFGDHTDMHFSSIINNALVVENQSKGRTYARTKLLVDPLSGRVLDRSVEFVDRTVEAHFQQGKDVNPEQIDALIEERISARQNKDYPRADEIRNQLTALGIELEDTADGTRWKLRGDSEPR